MADSNDTTEETTAASRVFCWPDTRSVIAGAVFVLTVMIFVMIYNKPTLTDNQGFMVLAQAVVVSALVGGVIAFFYGANKASDDKNSIISKQAEALNTTAATAQTVADTASRNGG